MKNKCVKNECNDNKNKQQKQKEQSIQQKLTSLFPKKPYSTQLKIATKLYQLLKQGQIKCMIVESPTGTGKTYALLVGVLSWLLQNPQQLKKKTNIKNIHKNDGQSENSSSSSFPSWLGAKNKQFKIQSILHEKKQLISKLMTIQQYKTKNKTKNSTNNNNKSNNTKLQWQVQDIEDIGNDNINQINGVKRQVKINQADDIFTQKECLPKIIFVSRTHSQLGQVIQSISSIQTDLKYVSMASKDHLCVHPSIQKTRVQQKCQYLLSHGGCPYYHQAAISNFFGLRVDQSQKLGQSHSICSYFAIKNLLPISNIICVPYATILSPQVRNNLNININNSIIIFDQAHNIIEQQLNLKSPQISYKDLELLCKRVDQYRQKYGQKMAENNRMLLSHIIQICRAIINAIRKQYENIVMNKQNQNQQMKIHGRKYQYNQLNQQRNKQKQGTTTYVRMSKAQFYSKLKIFEIKLYNIKNYISLSNFDQKLAHFNTKQPFSISIINSFIDFLTCLMKVNSCSSTSILTKQNKLVPSIQSSIILIKQLPTTQITSISSALCNASIKFFTMQSTQIAEIAKQARAIILAGGTMEPILQYEAIFNNNGLTHTFIKGQHVIKADQCQVKCIGGFKERKVKPNIEKSDEVNNKNNEYTNQFKITFTYQQMKNNSKRILQGSCKIIKKIINKTQGCSGTVIFIQSYSLIESLKSYLQVQINDCPIFYDTNIKNVMQNTVKKGKSNMNAFQSYQAMIKQQRKSAILVSVMGGRLSQGINFSDQLARNIIVLGLPYANIKTPQIIQKMKYLDLKLKNKIQMKKNNNQLPTFQSAHYNLNKNISKQSQLQQSGQTYYENCCMKIINQTIGRGIRHINDYCNIYLIDSRFAANNKKLPAWMTRNIEFIDYFQCQKSV